MVVLIEYVFDSMLEIPTQPEYNHKSLSVIPSYLIDNSQRIIPAHISFSLRHNGHLRSFPPPILQ